MYAQFIHQLIGIKEEKGRLKSYTQDVKEFVVNTPKGRFVFVDMPGFDDPHRSDRDVLRTIADWLEEKYESPPCTFHD